MVAAAEKGEPRFGAGHPRELSQFKIKEPPHEGRPGPPTVYVGGQDADAPIKKFQQAP